MSTNQAITSQIKAFPTGEPFSTSSFLKLGSRAAVDKSLSRLVEQGAIERVTPGIYVRPKKNRYVGSVKPETSKVIKAIAQSNGEVIQVHGAEAARQFKLSTQMPTKPSYYTSGSSRTITIGKLKVRLIHAAPRKLQLAGKKSGIALSALWYLGKEGLTKELAQQVMSNLSASEQKELLSTGKPAWMSEVLKGYQQERSVA